MIRASRRASVSLWLIGTLIALAFSAMGLFGAETRARETDASHPVSVYLFWRAGCPYCKDARAFLSPLAATDPEVELHELEIVDNELNRLVFIGLMEAYGIDRPAVPFVIVGRRPFIGYAADSSTGAEIVREIERCRREGCPDFVGSILERLTADAPATAPPELETGARPEPTGAPATIKLPLVGEIATGNLSLPMLTIVLAAVDGFNPCAMWVLVFLLGLLLGVRDPLKMWALGAVFLVTSAAVYFAFMAAWLNVVLVLGSLAWLRLVIGVLALGGGAYYMREYFANPEGVCKISDIGERQRIMARFRELVGERSFLLAALGIAGIAVGVNLVELLCSAGIPAIYTQVLSLSDLPSWQYYLYLALYIAVFLLDDAIVFATAMVTLQQTGATAGYTRYAHLIGGLVLIVIGALLLLRPDWLSFSI